MWAIILGMHVYSFLVSPHMAPESRTFYAYVGGAVVIASFAMFFYSMYSQPTYWGGKMMPKTIRVALCTRLFGQMPSNDMRRWRNDVMFRLSTYGFTSVLTTIAATYFVSPSSPAAGFAILVVGLSTVTVFDELRDCAEVMMKEEKVRLKTQ
ncbi:unnamed protein product [Aphanomyces euteiches]